MRLSETFARRGAGHLHIWIVGLEALIRYRIIGGGLNSFPDTYNE